MWDDRFLFVTASLAAMALWIVFDQSTRTKDASRYSLLSWMNGRTVLLAVILIAGGRLWLYRQDLSFPTAGSVIAMLIGAVFGSFTAKFIRSLFGVDFGRRDPIIGACVLMLLSIAYTLPLYSQAISGFLSGVGLSSIKTPILELTLRESQGGRGNATSVSGGATNAQFIPQAVPRATDPTPGLGWLDLDTRFECTKDRGCPTLVADKEYIEYLEYADQQHTPQEYSEIRDSTKEFLVPVQQLSICLNEYVKIVPDSQLLLVDIKQVIESLFQLHAEAKQALDPEPQSENASIKPSHNAGTNWKLNAQANNVLREVRAKIGSNPKCNDVSPNVKEGKFFYLQPYGALVLADLLVTHGAPDEAIRVLAEWLNIWNNWKKKSAKPEILPEWFELRVASRLALLMKNLASQSNIAYREFFSFYKELFDDYIGRSLHLRRLDQYPDRCKFWGDLSNKNAASPNLETEKRVFYLLLANEDEELRTQISFLSEQNNFEALEKLFRRARFMASIGPECLPDKLLDFPSRKGIVADHQVTAGLLGLTVADRMASIARSSGDRERARDIRRIAEDQLRNGWEDLRPLVSADRKKNQEKRWSERIFAESGWEGSASLATRALFQLRSGDY